MILETTETTITTPQTYKMERTAAIINVPGHPLQTFTLENEAISRLLQEAKDSNGLYSDINLPQLNDVNIHYAKKGDLLYPLLKVNYNITGPSDVMWTDDDEIRAEIASLLCNKPTTNYEERVHHLLLRMEKMVCKEANILYPICAVHISEEEWKGIYQDAKDYAPCLGVTNKIWDDGEKYKKKASPADDSEIIMAGGHVTLAQLTALLNTIPLEISFVDEYDINRYFNEGPKVFKRPAMSIGREVFSCHPPKIEKIVRKIIHDFKSGERDEVTVWMNKEGKTFLVKYLAVRDKDSHYLGTMELVQDMEFAKEHFAK